MKKTMIGAASGARGALVNQIEAKDDFLTAHKKQPMGLAAERKARRNGFRIGDD